MGSILLDLLNFTRSIWIVLSLTWHYSTLVWPILNSLYSNSNSTCTKPVLKHLKMFEVKIIPSQNYTRPSWNHTWPRLTIQRALLIYLLFVLYFEFIFYDMCFPRFEMWLRGILTENKTLLKQRVVAQCKNKWFIVTHSRSINYSKRFISRVRFRLSSSMVQTLIEFGLDLIVLMSSSVKTLTTSWELVNCDP